MRKILLIAKRDYLQVVLSRGYLAGLVVLPLLIGGSFGVMALANRGVGRTERVAIIDHTGGGAAAAILEAARQTSQPAASASIQPPVSQYKFEEVKPEADENAQLLSLSNEIRAGRVALVLVIDSEGARYYSNSAGFDQSGARVRDLVNAGLRRVRLAQLGIDDARISEALRDVPVTAMNLVKQDPGTGKIIPGEKRTGAPVGVVPYFLAILLMVVVMVGSAPNLGAIAEDKMQRVFEMLLCAATPFELMAGKVLASIGASLTTSAFYIAGGMMVLTGLATFQLAPLELLPWFFAYAIAAVAMLGAWSVALGSACATPQDAQHLAYLLIVPVMAPIFLMQPILQQPNSVLATALSLFPPFTPVLMLLRQGLPGGVPWWEPWLGLAGVLACALAVIWAASRIFRVGILSQGKTPKLPELMQWVLAG
ncbi:MAG TPA: ABC transporter permease [Bryobacteraceae bacterium]|nr:ABC transporter permease [Bryobacteraceae bacterium]